jgi:hypothetical protein
LSHSDEHGFDRWTRRRFGGAAGLAMGLTLAGVGLTASDAGKKKKKKKKHKKKGHEPGCLEENCATDACNPHGTPCCLCFNCIRLNPNAPYECSPIDLDE